MKNIGEFEKQWSVSGKVPKTVFTLRGFVDATNYKFSEGRVILILYFSDDPDSVGMPIQVSVPLKKVWKVEVK